MGIKLFHKGKRNITGEALNAAGEKVPFVFTPNTAVEFDDVTGANIKRLYAGEVISMDDVRRQFDQSTAPVGAVGVASATGLVDPAIAAAAEAERAATMEAEVKKRTYDALIAAGLTHEEAEAAAAPKKAESVEESKAEEVAEVEQEKAGLLDHIKGKKG